MKRHLAVFLLPLTLALSVGLTACTTDDPPPVGGDTDAGLIDVCGGCPCDQACNPLTAACAPRECGEGCADAAVLECGAGLVCRDGLCKEPTCSTDVDCNRVETDGNPYICVEDSCQPGCREDSECPVNSESLRRGRCLPDTNECGFCECATALDCAEGSEAGEVRDCANSCLCEAVECLNDEHCEALPDRGPGFVCDATQKRCVSQDCWDDARCADPHKHCLQRGDSGVCVCGDERNSGTCPDDDCRDSQQCQEWFGGGSICHEYKCKEQPCEDDGECPAIGVSCCEAEGYCCPTPCERDAECPRRRNEPGGVFYCDADIGTCRPGCRDNEDCGNRSLLCIEHSCTPALCRSADDCDRGTWCHIGSVSLPEGSDEGEGLCEPGCDEQDDCDGNRPCMIDLHTCGCQGDDDCDIFDASYVCVEGECSPPCSAHTDCQLDEACIAGHCVEDACRNDVFEPNDVQAEAPTLELAASEEQDQLHQASTQARICGEENPLDEDWFHFRLERADRLEVTLSWPLVDTDGDGVGDILGSCDTETQQLSARLWQATQQLPEPETNPEPDWATYPGLLPPNQPCSVTLSTRGRGVSQAATYLLSVQNQARAVVDYSLDVRLYTRVECLPDEWEPNDTIDSLQDAQPVFDCEEFLLAGGSLNNPMRLPAAEASFRMCAERTVCDDNGGDCQLVEDKLDHYLLRLRTGDELYVQGAYNNRLGELRAQLRAPQNVGFNIALEDVDPCVGGEANLCDEAGVGCADGELCCNSNRLECLPDPGENQGRFVLREAGDQVVVDGDYILQVMPAPLLDINIDMEASYSLEVSCEGPTVPCHQDPGGRNDSMDTAFCPHQQGGNCTIIDEPHWPWQAPGDNDPALHLCQNGEGVRGMDEDWYRFDLLENSSIGIRTENDRGPDNNWTIELTLMRKTEDGDPEVQAGWRSASNTGTNEINQRALPVGEYYLRVNHPENVLHPRTVPYSILVQITGGEIECVPDNFEPNDSLDNAFEIQDIHIAGRNDELHCLPANPESRLSLCAGNQDWFRIDLASLEFPVERLDIELRCDEADPERNSDLDLEVRLDDGTRRALDNEPDGVLACAIGLLDQCYDTGPGCHPARVRLDQPDDAAHFIGIKGANDPQNTYQLCYKVVPATCEDENGEPENDGRLTAPALEGQLNAWLCPDDTDWWTFSTRDIEENAWAKIEFGRGNASSPEITITDKSGNVLDCTEGDDFGLCEDTLGLENTLCFITNELPPDEYLIKVEQSNAARNWYDLSVETSANQLSCLD